MANERGLCPGSVFTEFPFSMAFLKRCSFDILAAQAGLNVLHRFIFLGNDYDSVPYRTQIEQLFSSMYSCYYSIYRRCGHSAHIVLDLFHASMAVFS